MESFLTVDAVSKLGFPIVAALCMGSVLWSIARWFMRTGDEVKARLFLHLDALDKTQSEIKPSLERIEARLSCAPQPPLRGFAEPAASH